VRVPVVIAAALTACLVLCGASPAHSETRVFTVLDFQFEDGSVLPDVHIAYETRGTLSPTHDNAILLIPGALGDRHVFDAAIGPGKTFDTDKYFVVTVDPIGGGESSSPADGMGQDFPRYTIRDMMAALYALATRELGVNRLRALGGLSMGSFVALEWAIHHPENIDSLVLMAPSPKSDAGFRLTVDLVNTVIALDAEWQGGRYTRNPVEGLRHAGMLFYPWLVSAAYLDRTPPQQLAKEVEATARAFGEWDANSLVLRYAAYRAHDVSAPYEGDMSAALAQIAAPTLVLTSASDRLVGVEGARRIADAVKRARYAEIPTDIGHRAMRGAPDSSEANFIDRQIRQFLAEPSPSARKK
jgi:homoserine O-acetyltransferase/O-succinyltransferase